MGTTEPDAEKEWLLVISSLFQVIHGGTSDDSVGRLFIGRLEPLPVDGMIARAVRIASLDYLIRRRSLAKFADFDIPRPWVLVFVSCVIDFANHHREITVLAEIFRQHDPVAQILAGRSYKRIDSGPAASQAAEKRYARRIANRVLAIGPVEPQAALRQLIDRRSFHIVVSVATHMVVQIIDNDKQYVQLGLHCGAGRGNHGKYAG